MAAIRTGAITVYNDGVETKYFVQGGFADVTSDGLTSSWPLIHERRCRYRRLLRLKT